MKLYYQYAQFLIEIMADTDFYEDIEYYVRVRCRYQDSCEWCLAHSLYNLKTITEIKKFYMNYIDEKSTGNIRWGMDKMED